MTLVITIINYFYFFKYRCTIPFNSAVSSQATSNGRITQMMNHKGFPSGTYPGTYLEGLRKIMKNLSQDSPCSGRDSNHWAKQYIRKCC